METRTAVPPAPHLRRSLPVAVAVTVGLAAILHVLSSGVRSSRGFACTRPVRVREPGEEVVQDPGLGR